MRSLIPTLLLLFAAGCGASEKPEDDRSEAFKAAESSSGPSAARDVEQLEAWSGKNIGLVGTFEHLRGVTGVLVLDSGLKVYLPHFDQVLEGDDWFKYVGKRCYAHGILHTYTRDIEGFRGPSLELNDFSGPSE
jgi:hypothetical protein